MMKLRQVGVEWCTQQSKELERIQGVPCLHYYSMGKSDSIIKGC
jgi:methylenetetrahydrofolate reductase (NADPH)